MVPSKLHTPTSHPQNPLTPPSFFRFCQANSKDAAADGSRFPGVSNDDDDDDFYSSGGEASAPTSHSTAPTTTFSQRTLFATISHLHILHSLTAHKAHRLLLLVHEKSSAPLKKCLKVPHPDLRLAALKCIKGQVPYCHRKWRQGNMRVITAIYLHCEPTLRDEWLAGLDVEGEIGEALPQEQALRALTAWFHARRYPVGGGEEGNGGEEVDEGRDFFAEELERMDGGRDGDMEEEGFMTDEEDVRWADPMQVGAWLTGN